MGGFLGSYVHQLDAKGRLSLPAPFRRENGPGSFVLIQVHTDALSLYPNDAWREVEDELRELTRRQPGARLYVLGLTANAQEVTPDKQGRILIPDRMRQRAGLVQEALVVGAIDKIEIWDPERFRESAGREQDEFSSLVAPIFA